MTLLHPPMVFNEVSSVMISMLGGVGKKDSGDKKWPLRMLNFS